MDIGNDTDKPIDTISIFDSSNEAFVHYLHAGTKHGDASGWREKHVR